jgi:membrane-bound serine protease (ClpP class)
MEFSKSLTMTRLLIGLLLFLSTFDLFSQSQSPKLVYVFEIDEEIAPPVVRRMGKAFEQAKNLKADLIIIQMNTYGGLVVSADTIRTRLLKSNIPTAVFIDNNAASAGALISIACDSIYMVSGANIGAATVVNQNAEAMPDKYQSYMRATMRATAEAKHRNPRIAEAMVDPDIYIPTVIDSGKVLTFTTSEAIKNGFCEAQLNSVEEVIARFGLSSYRIQYLELNAIDSVIDFLISPYIHSLLIMLIIGGIYFELQTPGFGFPSVVAITAAVLYFTPLYLEGVAENWELLVFALGIGLLLLEVFVVPGFGITGMSGIVLVILGLTLSLLNNVAFDFSQVSFNAMMEAVFIVIIAIFGAMLIIYFGITKMLSSRKLGLALTSEIASNQGFTSANMNLSSLINEHARTASILRPSGKIEYQSRLYDAVARESFIESGEEILIVGYINNQLVVTKFKQNEN